MSNRSLDSEVKVVLSGTVKNTLDDGQVASVALNASLGTGRLDNGISADEANRMWWSEERALGSGGTETIDLYDLGSLDIGAGAGNDGVGQAFTCVEIVAIAIYQDSGDGRIEIEPGASNGFTALGSHTVATGGALRTGGLLLKTQPHTDGYPVTDASNHTLKITANGAAATYSIYIIGRHDTDESSSSSSSSTSTLSSSSTSSLSTSSSLSSSSSSSTSSLSSASSDSSSSTSSESSSST